MRYQNFALHINSYKSFILKLTKIQKIRFKYTCTFPQNNSNDIDKNPLYILI